MEVPSSLFCFGTDLFFLGGETGIFSDDGRLISRFLLLLFKEGSSSAKSPGDWLRFIACALGIYFANRSKK